MIGPRLVLAAVLVFFAIVPAPPLAAQDPPLPFGPLPSARQLAWHDLEFYGFLHFSINTFTDREWGEGDESPKRFHPTDFDADQIVGTLADAGMRGVILTAKHHDGFCLWPTATTEHSVKKSAWKEGKGDVVRDIALAAKKRGLAFGVYLSPWDRNHPEYGKKAYVDVYRAQMRELLTGYGEIFEFWCDGANGGTGYYGGAREKRTIDRGSYYDWANTWKIAYELQPKLVVFSDVGPDVRWVGNENGQAGDPCWAAYTPHAEEGEVPAPGNTRYREGFTGHRRGRFWMPAEVDVSIRPGWFYHAAEDEKVRTAFNLVDLYYQSVGRGASLLLNVPPDRRGRIHEQDVRALRAMRERLDKTFAVDLAREGTYEATEVRAKSGRFSAAMAFDGDRSTYWSTDDLAEKPVLTVAFEKPRAMNVCSLREYLPLGQRVDAFAIEVKIDGAWKTWANGVGIGARRLVRGARLEVLGVRLIILGAAACPAISEFSVHNDPLAG